MIFWRENLLANRLPQIIIAVTVVASVCAAVAATPVPNTRLSIPAPPNTAITYTVPEQTIKPLASGPALRVGRVYDADDEDCLITVTRYTDKAGHLRVKHGVSCN